MEICVDFDGTCVAHEYPRVGHEIGAAAVLKELVKNGHKLIVFTMRDGKELNDALEWFEHHEIPLYGIQRNPTQQQWTSSPKAYGQMYIDDAALGCPLANLNKGNERPYVDWVRVREMLCERGLIKNEIPEKLHFIRDPEITCGNCTKKIYMEKDDFKSYSSTSEARSISKETNHTLTCNTSCKCGAAYRVQVNLCEYPTGFFTYGEIEWSGEYANRKKELKDVSFGN